MFNTCFNRKVKKLSLIKQISHVFFFLKGNELNMFIIFASRKLSVIIPVYRVEHTLYDCVKSVLNQQVEDMEVILVDDGSPDSCGDICDQLEREHTNIRVVHKKNGGLSDARNAGIELATGDYITFVDSDDFVAPDTWASLIGYLSLHPETDLLEFSYVVSNNGHEHQHRLGNHVYHDMNDYWLQGQAYAHTYAWNKLYRRSLFNEVRFPVGKLFEDIHTLPHLLRNCHTVVTTDMGFYHYCHNPHGITATAKGIELKDLLEGHLAFLKSHLSQLDIRSDSFAYYYAHLLNIQIDVAELTGEPPTIPILRVNPNTLKLIIFHYLGFNTLCNLSIIKHKLCRILH